MKVLFDHWPGHDGPVEFEVDDELYARAKADADRRGMTIDEWWNMALRREIEWLKFTNRPGWDRLPALRVPQESEKE